MTPRGGERMRRRQNTEGSDRTEKPKRRWDRRRETRRDEPQEDQMGHACYGDREGDPLDTRGR